MARCRRRRRRRTAARRLDGPVHHAVYAVGATFVFTAVGTFILLKITDVIVGLRVTEEEEREGLDVTLHGERLA